MNILLIVIVGVIFLVVLAKYPYMLSALLIFMMLYGFNIPTPFVLDLRGILIIVLLFRLLIDENNRKLLNLHFFKNKFAVLLVIFTLLGTALTFYYYRGLMECLRSLILIFGCLFLGYLTTANEAGKYSFLIGIFTTGLVATIDLVLTYINFGKIQPTRWINYFLFGEIDFVNHNVFGLMTGMSQVFAILFYLKNKSLKIIGMCIIVYSSLGLFLSTSRGTISGVLIILIVMSFVQEEMKLSLKKIISFGITITILFISFYFLYNTILKSVTNSIMLDSVYYRLFEEPLINLGLKDKMDLKTDPRVQLEVMDERYNKAYRDIKKFSNAPTMDILFGIGINGYVKSDYGEDGIGAHNGYTLMLIERGIFGTGVYLYILIGLILTSLKNAKKYKFDIPISYLILFIMIVDIAHGTLTTSPKAYLILGGTIGNLFYVAITSFKNNVKTAMIFQKAKEKLAILPNK